LTEPPQRPAADTADLDVLIVGAGLSGIGAARHLQQRCPDQRWAIVEARDSIGGTWDLFRYPGVRSDSDMYTLGYAFKPWRDAKAIADGPAILRYIREAADEAGITPRIRFGHRVTRADWSSDEACWTVRIEQADAAGTRAPGTLRARFLYLCAGYYSYARGHRPEFAGEADFGGRIVHPQFWPDDLDHAGRRVVVIGSGATAVTLVPEMARTAAQVTMLQRSPTYCVTRPAEDRLANWLNRRLPVRAAYALTRWKNVLLGAFFFRLARRRPEGVRRRLVELAQRQLGTSCDASLHFAPRYKPWDQRLCLVADGDLFRQIRKGRAAVVTGTIERFTAGGIRLADGRELAADLVVLATGLELNVLGDIALTVDGRPVDVGHSLSYKGMMLSDVPNLAVAFGYTNASWTLKADLTAAWVCRLLRHMRRHGHRIAVPRRDPTVSEQPLLDFTSGYVVRARDRLAKQGTRAPWRVRQSYLADLLAIRWGRLADGTLCFDEPAAVR
jgi:cation diffusion facilitator CzcD-associated flavoprotein CzcO